MKRFVVKALFRSCEALDRIPVPMRVRGEWVFNAIGLGCLLGLARLGFFLDEEWGLDMTLIKEKSDD